MDRLLYLLPVLVCPLAMGLLMWLMRAGHEPAQPPAAPLDDSERAEQGRLQAEATAQRPSGT